MKAKTTKRAGASNAAESEWRQHRYSAKAAAVEVARRNGIETLEARNSDRDDFHTVSVWQLEKMLIEAYERGAKAGSR